MSILVVEHEADAPIGVLGEFPAVWEVRRPYRGEDLPTLTAEYGGLIVLGGEMSADGDDDHPWLSTTKTLIADAVDRGVPTLLVCLGHQLGAVALGGSVETSAEPLWGVVEVRLTDAGRTDPLLRLLPPDARVVHWNGDLVTRLPDGATVLALDPRGGIQAVRYGPAAWGLQCHPEVDVEIVGSWADSQTEERAAGSPARAEAAMVDIEREMPDIHVAWRPVLSAFVDLATRR